MVLMITDMLFFPVFVMCMCISESRDFLIRRPWPAAGGYTAVCAMPNLNPVPDSREHLEAELAVIGRDATINVLPYAAITVGQRGEQLAALEEMAADVAGFSDDGRGVQRDEMMREAMLRAKKLGKMIVAHCEVNELLRGGYIHDGA